jgi:transketolase
MPFSLGSRRAVHLDVTRDWQRSDPLPSLELGHFEELDRLYRALCAILYNYVPTSGHPGGSISSGRFVAALLFDGLDYDVSRPEREDADVVSYAAGHKAMGLYALWALRDEVMRLGAPELLADLKYRLRLEDLFGFRRNPVTGTPALVRAKAKALDGHPTPQTPFVRLATGASGVGLDSSLGLALAARDYFGENAPRVHIVEGEGGLTPGRVAEGLAAAGTASLDNVVVHVDWNQASIDSNRVCREGDRPGEYVQWTPAELFLLHDWNVVDVPDGHDLQQIFAARRLAATIDNVQPTAIVYRTTKGWQYGIEGRASHGAGHKLCAGGFYDALAELTDRMQVDLPSCDAGEQRCADRETGPAVREACFADSLAVVRRRLESLPGLTEHLAQRLEAARDRPAQTPRASRRSTRSPRR